MWEDWKERGSSVVIEGGGGWGKGGGGGTRAIDCRWKSDSFSTDSLTDAITTFMVGQMLIFFMINIEKERF